MWNCWNRGWDGRFSVGSVLSMLDRSMINRGFSVVDNIHHRLANLSTPRGDRAISLGVLGSWSPLGLLFPGSHVGRVQRHNKHPVSPLIHRQILVLKRDVVYSAGYICLIRCQQCPRRRPSTGNLNIIVGNWRRIRRVNFTFNYLYLSSREYYDI